MGRVTVSDNQSDTTFTSQSPDQSNSGKPTKPVDTEMVKTASDFTNNQPYNTDIPPPDVPEEDSLGACGGTEASSSTTMAELAELYGSSDEPVQMFAVVPLPWCPHLETISPVPHGGLDASTPCLECDDIKENWVCLTCYEVHCGRYVQEHMVQHSFDTDHRMVLSYADISVWCYACDSYVDNQVLLEAKSAAHRSKFGTDMPS